MESLYPKHQKNKKLKSLASKNGIIDFGLLDYWMVRFLEIHNSQIVIRNS